MSATLQQLHASWVAKKEYAIRHGRPLPDYEWVERLLAEADRLAAENARMVAVVKAAASLGQSTKPLYADGDYSTPVGYEVAADAYDALVTGARAVLAERSQ